MKILLVEDNPLNQKVVTFILKKHNHNIIAVSNGYAAIRKMENEHFDLILMDIMLPGMNGYEITREIRKNKEKGDKIPIIALTANTLENDRDKCINAGMNDYLEKPFNSEQLLEIIEKYIEN